MDLDLRKLRYFAAVAEKRHFGRAAQQLYIAQPVLSRQVRALEEELGVVLLERTTRNVQVTPAGEQLYKDALKILAAADAATRRVHAAARRVEQMVLGFACGLQVSGAVRAFAQVHPDIDVQLVRLDWYEQADAIRDGTADVGYLRGPFDADGVHIVSMGTEPQVLVMPASHPMASRRRLRRTDVEGETVQDAPPRRTESVEEKFELIASGHGLATMPRSVARYYARPDLVHRPLADGVPYEICLAVAEDRRQQHLEDFLTVAAQALRPAFRR